MVNTDKLQHKDITCQKGNFEEERVQTLLILECHIDPFSFIILFKLIVST